MTISRRDFLIASGTVMAASAAASPVRAATGRDPDVLVIGAGLSGLGTALALEEAGLRVRVLEGRDRVGGRLYTLDGVQGHPEAGGNSVAAAYGRVIAAGKRFGVELDDIGLRAFGGAPPGLYIDGAVVAPDAWAGHPRNPFSGELKGLQPGAWASALLARNVPFKDLGAWWDPANAKYDISVYDFLASLGASDAAIQLGFDANISYGTTAHDVSLLMLASVEQWQLVNRNANARVVGAFRGGNQRLPEAMARHLRGDLLYGRRVGAITTRADGAEVLCSDGSRHRAKAVVCSMPFATLRHVAIDPLPPAAQNTAIRTIGYVPITQVHIVPKSKFWESDGQSPSMWTDGVAGTVYAQRFGPDPKEVMSLTCWARGLNAQYLDLLGPEAAGRAVVAELERLRPAAKGALEVATVRSWGTDPFSAGVWSYYRPGQVGAFAAELAKPHGRLFFCGEHTALGSRGMEAALESAERAAVEVQVALG